MQNPAETPSPVDDEVGALREEGVSPPTQAAPVPGSHSTPPPQGPPREVGGPSGPEPTRYGDWERKGRCIDF
jgi:hypothetical protein